MSNQVDTTEHIGLHVKTYEVMERELTPLQRLLACKKRQVALPQDVPSDPSQALSASDPLFEAQFKPLETSFYEETLRTDSMEIMKCYIQFTRVKRDLEQRVLDVDTLHTFLTTCQLSDFDQFDCDIMTFFPTGSKEETMLTLCHAFCDLVHHHGFPMEAEETNYFVALIRLYVERHPMMALGRVRKFLDVAITNTRHAMLSASLKGMRGHVAPRNS